MSSFTHSTKKFGAIEIAQSTGFIDANESKVKHVQYPTESGDATNKQYVDRFYNVGDLKMSVRSTDFYGWLKCDGRSLSRTTYATLFSIIGTSFGNVDGDTFNLPDCRGRVLGTLGQGTGLTNRILGTSVGAETHTLTTGEIPSHSHTINDPGHTHTYVNNTNDANPAVSLTTTTVADNADLNATTGSSTTGIIVNATGDGGARNNMQPTIFIGNTFIYSGVEN